MGRMSDPVKEKRSSLSISMSGFSSGSDCCVILAFIHPTEICLARMNLKNIFYCYLCANLAKVTIASDSYRKPSGSGNTEICFYVAGFYD